MRATLKQAADRFFASRRIAVVGASRSPTEPGGAVLRKLHRAGIPVVPVNPRAESIDGVPCHPDVASIPGPIDAAFLATPPERTAAAVDACVAHGAERIWIHRAIGPGSLTDEAIGRCRHHGVELIPGGCPMMHGDSVDFGHRCMAFGLGLFGRLPEPEGGRSE